MFGIYPWQLYLSRILSGLGSGGAFTLVPIFIAEISESRYVILHTILKYCSNGTRNSEIELHRIMVAL